LGWTLGKCGTLHGQAISNNFKLSQIMININETWLVLRSDNRTDLGLIIGKVFKNDYTTEIQVVFLDGDRLCLPEDKFIKRVKLEQLFEKWLADT